MSSAHDNTLHYPLKALARLLAYPDAELIAHVDDLADVLVVRPELDREETRAVERFVAWLRSADLLDVQAAYVETFDRSKKVSLYLFEHVHGESRDRGPAMIELNMAYRERGLVIDASELPDYLPLFLEFCAELDEATARAWLEDTGHILQEIHVRLAERGSRHAAPLMALLRVIGLEAMPEALVETASREARDDTREALDQTWMEAPVTFGPDAARTSCGATRQWREPPLEGTNGGPAAGRSTNE